MTPTSIKKNKIKCWICVQLSHLILVHNWMQLPKICFDQCKVSRNNALHYLLQVPSWSISYCVPMIFISFWKMVKKRASNANTSFECCEIISFFIVSCFECMTSISWSVFVVHHTKNDFLKCIETKNEMKLCDVIHVNLIDNIKIRKIEHIL